MTKPEILLPPDRGWLCREPDGGVRIEGKPPAAILAGSFNPLHAGHHQLAERAALKLKRPVAFEISLLNVDKPELMPEEIAARLEQFNGLAPVFLTRAPTFEQKAALFPDCVMVVGVDTAERIVSNRYYATLERRDQALAFIREQGCRFLVAGRHLSGRGYLTLDDVDIPESFRDLFEQLGEAEFRVDLSSSELRNWSAPGGQKNVF